MADQFLDPLLQQVKQGDSETKLAPKAIDHYSKLRLGPSAHLASKEIPPKHKNFKERLARQGRPNSDDVLYGNFDSEHKPHALFKKDGKIVFATGKKAGLFFLMDPVKHEISMGGNKLNLVFNDIDIRALNMNVLVQHMVDLIIQDGNLMAKIVGEVMLRSQTMTLHADKWMKVETRDLHITTNLAVSSKFEDALKQMVGGAVMGKGSVTITTDQVTMSASNQYVLNSPSIKHGHDGLMNPFGLGPLPPVRPNARMFDSTTHFCPYVAGPVKGWIDSGSAHMSST